MAGLSRAIGLRNSLRHFSTSRVQMGNPYGWDGTVPEEHKNKKELLSAGMGYHDFYCGHPGFPAESVRFLPDSPYVANVLRPKEMQDWKALSQEEKKTLYRTAYQTTIVELIEREPSMNYGELGIFIFYFALTAIWFMYYIHVMTPFPQQLDRDVQEKIWQNVVAANRGLAMQAAFDYETNTNLKRKWYQLRM